MNAPITPAIFRAVKLTSSVGGNHSDIVISQGIGLEIAAMLVQNRLCV